MKSKKFTDPAPKKSAFMAPWFLFSWMGLILLVVGLLSVPPAQITYAQIGDTETPTATASETATETATASPTATSTASVTSTATASPTITGTPPTPTATGTITPNPLVTITVSPTQASINQLLTFIIRITNPGTAPATNSQVFISFPNYMDVTSATLTGGSGTVNTTVAHAVTVTLGNLMPGSNLTITIVARVNSSLTRTETVSSIASLTYNSSFVRSASTSYTVLVTPTLPGTGHLPITRPVSGWTIWAGGLSGPFVLGLGALLVGRGGKPSRQRKIFLAVIFTGLILVGLAACAQTAQPTLIAAVPGQVIEIPTPTLLPYMPAYRFATPEALVEMPDYPVPTPTLNAAAGVEPGQAKADDSPVVRLAIPALNLDIPVDFIPYDGLTWPIDNLRQQAAWLGNTSWPGLGSNTVLAGHVTVRGLGDGPFRYLENLAPGEQVYVYTENSMYTYTVREQFTVNETDMGVTLPTVNPQLTLITCTGWDTELSIYRFRRVVVADLVNSEPQAVQGFVR